MNKPVSRIGIDIGSTTVKMLVAVQDAQKPIYLNYRRHGARQVETLLEVLEEVAASGIAERVQLSLCGSGARGLANILGVRYVQEVVATSIAIRSMYPTVRTAIELGGQDAKVIFFHQDELGKLQASDMRMNGVCAGGTGAFIDEVASILHVPVEEFNALAAQGRVVHEISGRCGVFAKTDIQPLLNQGVPLADLALSTFHAIAKQTIGGLAQGLEIKGPVAFVGGPLAFNPVLIKVFQERLALGGAEIIVPPDPKTLVVQGAALALVQQAEPEFELDTLIRLVKQLPGQESRREQAMGPFFLNPEERSVFNARHALGLGKPPLLGGEVANAEVSEKDREQPGPPMQQVRLFVGLDGGSTTSKCVAISEDARVLGTWYENNRGNPLGVMVALLKRMEQDFRSRAQVPHVLGMGTTGYAEQLFAKAFRADYHTVETVAHAHAALHCVPGASFVLDIGGQDMKALFIQDEIVTGIVLNEACSAGCGSFLENFAGSLGIPVTEIAEKAFASSAPAVLGSRCTVFMNSSIISEQRDGKTPDDILAGLCRSIIENVFSKVIRIPNLEQLGARVVVQGGTFRNDAVLRAMEQYLGREVVRAPLPGEMGALGVALLTRKAHDPSRASSFIGFEALRDFRYSQESGQVCPHCSNSCSRTIVSFPDGSAHITGNRCERGEQLGVLPAKARTEQTETRTARSPVPDLMRERQSLLLRDWPHPSLLPAKAITIGMPLALEFWESLPFWRAFWLSLGFGIKCSSPSTQALYQRGLGKILSDTVCFPAKLVHGHVQDLLGQGVDRLFMPMMNRMPPENPTTSGNHVCAVVKGYPLVVQNSDDPWRKAGVAFDHPMFHWFDKVSRDRQLAEWMALTFGIAESLTLQAIAAGDQAQNAFKAALRERGREVLAALPPQGLAVVLAGRPYQNDPLVNHDLNRLFVRQGIPVLPVDALSGLEELDLSRTRVEITTPFHTRMYSAAMQVAADQRLELVQMVSFGCGHDAVISDEVQRLMRQIADKTPLILKLDESEVAGPLGIRVRSFVETVKSRRAKGPYPQRALPEPFKVKFTKKEKKEKTILIPNVSPAFSKMLEAAMSGEGYRVEVLPLADREAIALGKKYIHNDMCFPAQVNVGEMLGALRSGRYDPDTVVCGLAKSECDCRLAHYAALARQALDDAGYPQVPIITTDRDNKGMHPAFSLGLKFQIRAVWGLNMVDVLEHVRRRLRPYELVAGQCDELFNDSIAAISRGLRQSVKAALKAFDAAIACFAALPARLDQRRPRVFVIGEFLLNFHAGSNNAIERYLEEHGMEVVLPDAFAPMHRDFLKKEAEARQFHIRHPYLDLFANGVTLSLIDLVKRAMAKRLRTLPFMQMPISLRELAAVGDQVVHHTFTPGEGWLIAAEILHHAQHGMRNFIILQPFGCLPNHIVGRGLVKKLKELWPGIQILPLDFDPDTSIANIENRLQMLVLNAQEQANEVHHEP